MVSAKDHPRTVVTTPIAAEIYHKFYASRLSSEHEKDQLSMALKPFILDTAVTFDGADIAAIINSHHRTEV